MINIIKPELTLWAMCIYKFTFSNGFYYYGATTNLSERISAHMKKFRDRTFSKIFMDMYDQSSYIKFEIIRYVNDRKLLGKIEESFLCKHVGLPKCLNSTIACTSAFKRGEAVFEVAKVSMDGVIMKKYKTSTMAAIDLGISVSYVGTAVKSKYPRGEYALRRLNDKGEIEIPILPYRDYPSLKKKVAQFDLDMNFIDEFESIQEASRKTGIDYKGISKVINGRGKTISKFIFKPI